MKTLISFLLLVALNVSAGGLVISWVNDVANPIGTQTIVSYGIAPNNYTNSFLVAYGVSTVTVSNLPPGVRFYVAVKATDGVDSSVYSNEDNAKTKLNPPKNTTATP